MEDGGIRIEWTGHDGFRLTDVLSRADWPLAAPPASGVIDCEALQSSTAGSDTHPSGQALYSQGVALKSPTPGQGNRLHPWQCLGY